MAYAYLFRRTRKKQLNNLDANRAKNLPRSEE